MTTKQKVYLVFGMISFLTTILFVGQFYGPDDGDRTLFLKHKPTVKQFFYSPVAYYRYHPRELSPKEEIEEKAFQEYIAKRDLHHNGNTYILLAILLIQLTLTLLTCGIFSVLKKTSVEYWQLILQFVLILIPTAFTIIYILLADNTMTSMLVSFIILAFNFLTISLLNQIKFKKTSSITVEEC